MAAPQIAGIAALYLEAYPSAAAYQVHYLPFQLPTILPFRCLIVPPGSSPTVGPGLHLHVQKHKTAQTHPVCADYFNILACQFPEHIASHLQTNQC